MRVNIIAMIFFNLCYIAITALPNIEYSIPSYVDADKKLSFQISATNNSDKDIVCHFEYSLQKDSNMYDMIAPDTKFGTNHARGKSSIVKYDGLILNDKSATDGLEWTGVDLPWRGEPGYKLITQTIDIGTIRNINKIDYISGDAKWIWNAGIETSLDGTTFVTTDNLKQINMNNKFGKQEIQIDNPIAARYIRINYYPPDKAIANKFCLPTEILIYDGVTDENFDIPVTGDIKANNKKIVIVPANQNIKIDFESSMVITTGGYLLTVRVTTENEKLLKYQHYFVMPENIKSINKESKFGINGASIDQIPMIRKLGVGWVRFENMKCPMISPKTDLYKYDGSVGPWYVKHDDIMKGYADAGLNILPYLFQSSSYNSTAPKSSKHGREYPPEDFDKWSDFCYQTVIRYGNVKHPDAEIKTPDKLSGMGIINSYEIWNEPNLDNPDWGAWVGTLPEYYKLLRLASQKIKLADTTALVTNGGYAGIDLHEVDMLRTYTYEDNTHPIDYIDVINVHYYTGRSAPEIATVNTNIYRNENEKGTNNYEEMLNMLADWRKINNINKPVWLTETGYDTGGPKGVNEQLQAAWLPRDIMTALGAGINKVFVYREKGSNPGLYAASGLVRDDNTLKPAWFTYATLIRQLDGAYDGIRLPHVDENVRIYAWRKAGKIILSAWTINGNAMIECGECRYVDSFGNTFTVNENNKINLGIFPIYIHNISDTKTIESLIEKAKNVNDSRMELLKEKAKKEVILYDFGVNKYIGSVNYGSVRYAIPVSHKDVWDEEKGFGFRTAAMRDGDKAWINDALERDFTVMSAGLSFKFFLKSGKYRFRISATPFGDSSIMTIKGFPEGNKSFKVIKDKNTTEFSAEVKDDIYSIEFDKYTELHWFMILEENK